MKKKILLIISALISMAIACVAFVWWRRTREGNPRSYQEMPEYGVRDIINDPIVYMYSVRDSEEPFDEKNDQNL